MAFIAQVVLLGSSYPLFDFRGNGGRGPNLDVCPDA